MGRALLGALAAVAFLALPGASVAGSYVPPPGDALPVWSPDGDRLAFLTSRASTTAFQAVAVTPWRGGTEIVGVQGVTSGLASISPDWRWVAYWRFAAGGAGLWIARMDGSEERVLAKSAFGDVPVWSPDSRRLAFRAGDESVSVVEIDGVAAPVRIAPGGADPTWAPDGSRIAFMGGRVEDLDLYVASADGSGEPVRIVDEPEHMLEPKWSPDGSRIAFLMQVGPGTPLRFGLVRPDGEGLVTFPGPGVSNSRSFAWMPSSDRIVFARHFSQGIYMLDLRSGRTTRLTAFGATPAPSPDGARIAFAAGGECRDRYGIYTARNDGARVRRLTNDCRILGTQRNDVLRGTGLADVLVGLGGADRLSGLSGGYVGDTLDGGSGDDVLIGSTSYDLLRGAGGADRLFGGFSADVLYGGEGRDRIDAQGGRDFVHARDGSRDMVLCGTNLARIPERDEVWADKVDVVARDCEIVHRSRG